MQHCVEASVVRMIFRRVGGRLVEGDGFKAVSEKAWKK